MFGVEVEENVVSLPRKHRNLLEDPPQPECKGHLLLSKIDEEVGLGGVQWMRVPILPLQRRLQQWGLEEDEWMEEDQWVEQEKPLFLD